MPAPARLVTALLATAALASCGGDGEGARAPADGVAPADDPGAAHIHGLGVDPADGALVIATHSGMFRAAAGEARPRRIGDRRQDTMGFTVVGAGRFLGSGHPDPRDDLPPLLGLIRSDDGGASWSTVSLLGEADFHVLRAAGTRVYGVNSADGRLMVSDDGGRRWAARTPPAEVVDLAPHPRRPDELLAATARGLYASRDAGRRWRPVDAQRTGLLAWPRSGSLVLVAGDGSVAASGDAGRTWTAVGQIGGQPAALAAHGRDLYVATHANEVKVSGDGGRTWRLRATAS